MNTNKSQETHRSLFLKNHSFILRGLFYATAWAITETIFRSLFITDNHGNISVQISLRFLYPSMLPGAAFAGWCIFEPIFVHVRFHNSKIVNRIIRYTIAYPLGIWTFEIIYGSILFNFFNQTRAWFYHGDWAFFNGYINLSYYFFWVGFGFLADLLAGTMVKVKLLHKPETL